MNKKIKELEKLLTTIQRPKNDGVQNAFSEHTTNTTSRRKDPLGNFIIRSIQETTLDDFEREFKDTNQNKNPD